MIIFFHAKFSWAIFASKKSMKTPSKPTHKLYDVAESLFVEKGMTCTAIAEDLKIREATLSGWRVKMQWDDARQKFLTTPGAIRKLLLAEMEFVAGGGKARTPFSHL